MTNKKILIDAFAILIHSTTNVIFPIIKMMNIHKKNKK
jgi:hypothetical protein